MRKSFIDGYEDGSLGCPRSILGIHVRVGLQIGKRIRTRFMQYDEVHKSWKAGYAGCVKSFSI